MSKRKVLCFGKPLSVYKICYAMYKNKRLLVREELAEWLRISPQTISNRLSRGDDLPPSIKFGGSRRWREQDVSDWLEKKVESTTLDDFK